MSPGWLGLLVLVLVNRTAGAGIAQTLKLRYALGRKHILGCQMLAEWPILPPFSWLMSLKGPSLEERNLRKT